MNGAQGFDPSEPGRLVRLERRHGPALLEFLRQYRACPEQLHGYHLDPELPHDEVVRTLDAWSEGRELRSGWVPQTTWFWQVDGDLAGVISLRHQLTPGLERHGGHIGYSTAPSHRRRGVATHMLRAVLGEALGLGIERVLITCDVDNVPSWRTIERCGGQLLDERWNHDLQRRTRRYVVLGRGG